MLLQEFGTFVHESFPWITFRRVEIGTGRLKISLGNDPTLKRDADAQRQTRRGESEEDSSCLRRVAIGQVSRRVILSDGLKKLGSYLVPAPPYAG